MPVIAVSNDSLSRLAHCIATQGVKGINDVVVRWCSRTSSSQQVPVLYPSLVFNQGSAYPYGVPLPPAVQPYPTHLYTRLDRSRERPFMHVLRSTISTIVIIQLIRGVPPLKMGIHPPRQPSPKMRFSASFRTSEGVVHGFQTVAPCCIQLFCCIVVSTIVITSFASRPASFFTGSPNDAPMACLHYPQQRTLVQPSVGFGHSIKTLPLTLLKTSDAVQQ